MANIICDLWDFYRECWREAHSKAWTAANGLFGSLIGVVMTVLMPFRFFPDHPNWNTILTFIIYAAVAYAIFLIFMLILVSPFLAWRKERTNRLNLASKPRLKCSFNVQDAGCFRPGTTISDVEISTGAVIGQHKCDWYRLRLDAEGGNVPNCQAYLISVERDGATVFSGDAPPLVITHHGEQPTTIYSGVPKYVDLLAIYESDRIDTAVSRLRRTSSADWDNMFSKPGNYCIRAAVVSPDAETASIDVTLKWTGSRATSEIG
jgi:hypothetical protein